MNPLIIVPAATRLTQLVVEDLITQPIRDAVQDRATVRTEQVRTTIGTTVPQPVQHPFWGKVDEAINCGACMSIWAAAAVFAASRLGPVGRFLVRVLAVSQGALAVKAVIERIDR